MGSLSQKHLMKLAQEDEEKKNYQGAIQNLEEALEMGHNSDIVLNLSKLYRKNKQGDQAYALIKGEPDLFSEQKVFKEYCHVLAENNFLIEALQLENLLGETLPVKVTPVDTNKQQEIMQMFRMKPAISQFDYQNLLKLDLINFKNFAQSLLLDPAQNFAVRLAICEDLIRLGIDEKIKIWVIGEQTTFIPKETELLEKSPIYQEVIAGIADKFRNNPSQLPMMIGEANLVLGSLYPKLSAYIKNTDRFTSDFVSFLKTRDGRSHQSLLEKIYQNLPK